MLTAVFRFVSAVNQDIRILATTEEAEVCVPFPMPNGAFPNSISMVGFFDMSLIKT